MQLTELLNALKTQLQENKDAQARVTQALSQDSINASFKEAFGVFYESFKESLEARVREELKTTKDSLVQTHASEIQELFSENLELLSQKVLESLNLKEIATKVAKNLESQKEKELKELLAQALDIKTHLYPLDTTLEKAKQEIHLLLTDFQKSISKTQNDLPEVKREFQRLCQELIIKNKDKIFKSQNLAFLKETLKDSSELKETIKNTAIQTTKTTLRKRLDKDLKHAMQEVIEPTAKDLIKEHLQKAYIEQTINSFFPVFKGLQNEILMIEHTIGKIYSLKVAKGGVKHNILKAI